METMSNDPSAHPTPNDFELPVDGFKGTPEEIERQWFEQVYTGRGDSMAQLTWRTVLMGSLLGGVLSLTNLYIGLKAGWGFGVAITACILSYSIWTAFFKIGLVKTQMTILENNCMQSTASSAGYSTGGTLISAFAAFLMMGNDPLPIPIMLGWIFFLAVLGVTMAIPMKRQMINIEQLRFPSGIAAAETLQALHSHGDKAMRSAKALGIAGVLAGLNQFWVDGPRLLDKLKFAGVSWEPLSLGALMGKINDKIFGSAWTGRTVMFKWDPVFLAAGADRLARGGQHDVGRHPLLGRLRADHAARGRHPGHRLPRDRAVDALGRSGLHGLFRPALLRHAMANHVPRRERFVQGLFPQG